MTAPLLSIALRSEQDVVHARQHARQLAEQLGFDHPDQIRIATAVSEIARNAFAYARHGMVDLIVIDKSPARFQVQVRDKGPGIADLPAVLEGRFTSSTGMGMGILGARRLMDSFHIETSPEGTLIQMEKRLPARSPAPTPEVIANILNALGRTGSLDASDELHRQNQELLHMLEELRQRNAETERLKQELEETNRGVMALYAELDEKAQHLKQASEQKTRFLSNMSHEFRTPVNSILSLSQLLLDRVDGELSPEQERQVYFIRRSAQDLSELVSDLLDMARIEAGKVAVRVESFEAGDLLSTLKGMFRPLTSSSDVKMIYEPPPEDFPTLRTDEGKLAQILRNFISNAVKFTPSGEIRVSARPRPNGMVAFSVSDTGIGIAPQDQPRIFEEFTQIEGPHQRKIKGTGLGLPLSRKLAELLGGFVTVRSVPGAGSTFEAVLPAVFGGSTNDTYRLEPGRHPVLVIDEDPELLSQYAKYLEDSIFQAVPLRTLDEARDALDWVRPVAILLDVLLDGGEVAWPFVTELKASDATSGIPFIVVSGPQSRPTAVAMGAEAFFPRPLAREPLLDCLHRCIRQTPLLKALVIDDDEVSRYLLKGLLSQQQLTCIEAGNGQDGLMAARKERPGVIFLDLMLPDITGFEVLRALKADVATLNIPVIVHSARQLTEAERKLLMEDAVVILSKESTSRETALGHIQKALVSARLIPAASEDHLT